MQTQYKKEQLFSTPELRDRGWSDTMIKKLMPIHDDEHRNPKFRTAAPMKLFKKRRVYSYERGKNWKTMNERYLKRKDIGLCSANKSVQTKIKNTVKQYENIEIEVPKGLNVEQLKHKALRHYNERASERSPVFLWIRFKDVDSNFINRITVNYIRHMLTDYDSVIETTHNQVGVIEARILIKNKAIDAITEAYPELKDECDNQSVINLNN